jgi:hypothetical protein
MSLVGICCRSCDEPACRNLSLFQKFKKHTQVRTEAQVPNRRDRTGTRTGLVWERWAFFSTSHC